VARRSRLAEDPRDRVEAVLRGAAFAREQIHGEPDVARLGHAPRDVLDVAREPAVLVADEHDREGPRLRRPGEIPRQPGARAGKFGNAGDDRGIVGRDQGRRAGGRLRGRRALSMRLENLRREHRAREPADRLQRLAAREPSLLVVLDGFLHQIALQLIHDGSPVVG